MPPSITKKELCEVLYELCTSHDTVLVNDLQLLTPHLYDDSDDGDDDKAISETSLEILTNLLKSVLTSKEMKIRLNKKDNRQTTTTTSQTNF